MAAANVHMAAGSADVLTIGLEADSLEVLQPVVVVGIGLADWHLAEEDTGSGHCALVEEDKSFDFPPSVHDAQVVVVEEDSQDDRNAADEQVVVRYLVVVEVGDDILHVQCLPCSRSQPLLAGGCWSQIGLHTEWHEPMSPMRCARTNLATLQTVQLANNP